MNPALITQPLGRNALMLVSMCARWINSSSIWSKLEQLNIGIQSLSTPFSKPQVIDR
ncbi:integrase [Pseudomonas spirodelae]|uniref:Integrase n=1 Tax=Pseudomonas spirodelae TaxID=3101751 RepID=A0ABU5PCE3_9PSED|nr:integrase [Pseudomonas sp. T5W1]MEA1607295.1 integrase [Pseudomonas sp. T5W1]